MILLTGGLGLIGSNLVSKLNNIGIYDIIIVDSYTSQKAKNIEGLKFSQIIDKHDFRSMILSRSKKLDFNTVIHMGACSDTTEKNLDYLTENNLEYSKDLLNMCIQKKIKFIYASSASVYGTNDSFKEIKENEAPINYYAQSKLDFDNYVRETNNNEIQVTGLRFFNVFGPNEAHKNRMASTIFHFYKQIKRTGCAKLFKGTDGISNGEQLRDFVYVKDCVNIIIWFLENDKSGIYNVGSGNSNSFNRVANSIINKTEKGKIEYIEFPKDLIGSYQNFTMADLTNLRGAGCDYEFTSLDDSISDYIDELEK